jgi:hypothetical protein
VIGKIMSRVEINEETGCWEWQGPTSGDGRGGGYGRMYLDGQTVAVHLVSYVHFYGFIPGKLQVDHVCCNRCCCNPLHLELVNQSENIRRQTHRKLRLEVCNG